MSSARSTAAAAVVLLASVSVGLSACSDPGANAAGNKDASPAPSATVSGKVFNLTPQQDRFPVTADPAAAALVPDAVKADGKLTVAVSPFAAPLAVYANDDKTPVGNEVDIAFAVAEKLGLKAEVVPTTWENWPLGVASGKYEAVISNVTVTEERKEKFDFASYRSDKLGFYAKSDSSIGSIQKPADVAGKKIIVGSGTNQESIWPSSPAARTSPSVPTRPPLTRRPRTVRRSSWVSSTAAGR